MPSRTFQDFWEQRFDPNPRWEFLHNYQAIACCCGQSTWSLDLAWINLLRYSLWFSAEQKNTSSQSVRPSNLVENDSLLILFLYCNLILISSFSKLAIVKIKCLLCDANELHNNFKSSKKLVLCHHINKCFNCGGDHGLINAKSLLTKPALLRAMPSLIKRCCAAMVITEIE